MHAAFHVLICSYICSFSFLSSRSLHLCDGFGAMRLPWLFAKRSNASEVGDACFRCTKIPRTMYCCAAAPGTQHQRRHVRSSLLHARLGRLMCHQQSPSLLCRLCNSPRLQKMLNRGLCLTPLQGLPHLKHFRRASG